MQKNIERLVLDSQIHFLYHGYPPEQLSGEYARGLIKMVLGK
ncbi:hypothetical protein NMY3_00663 [Candidatus Nitrosocosmicus oleophilus]|jgi:hypothetical protein|uniref:Uncharacterized protein n=1 Tax=Candidatus Nitrosocosmicus oleophilus TaxID=1353260 RepID=A0A654M6A2_9ARCH|nr:hypothetical protein [Candidatus Nitrosocosmicus oleophilus]ALI34872.1 hypothetical protein NMY3_00663 [Candidatus Nitrosocosmicus oleophilus]